MTTHLTDAELDAWCGDLADEATCARIEAHVGGCPACAERLRRAARFELALSQVARPSRRRSPVRWGLAALAVAAGVLLASRLFPAPSAVEPAPDSWIRECLATRPSVDCSSDASRRGIRLGSEVPRYEDARARPLALEVP